MSRVVLFALICFALAGFAAVSLGQGIDGDPGGFMRGDANDDDSVNTSDVIFISNFLYSGGPYPPCWDQADVNDDGFINATDPVYLSNWLFGHTEPIRQSLPSATASVAPIPPGKPAVAQIPAATTK